MAANTSQMSKIHTVRQEFSELKQMSKMQTVHQVATELSKFTKISKIQTVIQLAKQPTARASNVSFVLTLAIFIITLSNFFSSDWLRLYNVGPSGRYAGLQQLSPKGTIGPIDLRGKDKHSRVPERRCLAAFQRIDGGGGGGSVEDSVPYHGADDSSSAELMFRAMYISFGLVGGHPDVNERVQLLNDEWTALRGVTVACLALSFALQMVLIVLLFGAPHFLKVLSPKIVSFISMGIMACILFFILLPMIFVPVAKYQIVDYLTTKYREGLLAYAFIQHYKGNPMTLAHNRSTYEVVMAYEKIHRNITSAYVDEEPYKITLGMSYFLMMLSLPLGAASTAFNVYNIFIKNMMKKNM